MGRGGPDTAWLLVLGGNKVHACSAVLVGDFVRVLGHASPAQIAAGQNPARELSGHSIFFEKFSTKNSPCGMFSARLQSQEAHHAVGVTSCVAQSGVTNPWGAYMGACRLTDRLPGTLTTIGVY